MKEKPFECSFCGASFVHETRYLKHKCEKMQRHEDIKSTIGQSAYMLYQIWFTTKKKTAPSIESFINSRYYKPFVRFAEFVKRVRLPEPELYIKLMNENGVSPSMWTMNEMYGQFLEFLDRKLSPKKQAGITIRTMEKVADAAECEIYQIFDVLTGSDIIQLIRERKLSPWVLLRSRKFMVKVELMSKEEQQIIESLIRVDYWKQKFQNRQPEKAYMDKLVKELDL
jgi:hypothetical protein